LNLQKRLYSIVKEFSKNLQIIVEESLKVARLVVIIKILKTVDLNEKRSFNFNKKIEEYNKTIDDVIRLFKTKEVCQKKVVILIDPNHFSDGLLDDGIHINKEMHDYLTNQILSVVEVNKC